MRNEGRYFVLAKTYSDKPEFSGFNTSLPFVDGGGLTNNKGISLLRNLKKINVFRKIFKLKVLL